MFGKSLAACFQGGMLFPMLIYYSPNALTGFLFLGLVIYTGHESKLLQVRLFICFG